MKGKRMERQDRGTDGFDGANVWRYIDFMDARLTRLEEISDDTRKQLYALAADVAIIRSNYVTKDDLGRELNKLTWRLITFFCAFNSALFAAALFVSKYVL
jgi:hypothetical protein